MIRRTSSVGRSTARAWYSLFSENETIHTGNVTSASMRWGRCTPSSAPDRISDCHTKARTMASADHERRRPAISRWLSAEGAIRRADRHRFRRAQIDIRRRTTARHAARCLQFPARPPWEPNPSRPPLQSGCSTFEPLLGACPLRRVNRMEACPLPRSDAARISGDRPTRSRSGRRAPRMGVGARTPRTGRRRAGPAARPLTSAARADRAGRPSRRPAAGAPGGDRSEVRVGQRGGRARARWALRHADEVGDRVRLRGRPAVTNRGPHGDRRAGPAGVDDRHARAGRRAWRAARDRSPDARQLRVLARRDRSSCASAPTATSVRTR